MSSGDAGTRLAAGALLRAGEQAGPGLRLLDGSGPGRRVPLGEGLTLGRGRRADLRLEDPAASRLHVRVVPDGEGFVATDLGSRNGLTVNGSPSRSPCRLRFGDRLSVGRSVIVLEPGAIPDPVAEQGSGREAPADDGRPVPSAAAARPASIPLAVAALLAAAAALLAFG